MSGSDVRPESPVSVEKVPMSEMPTEREILDKIATNGVESKGYYSIRGGLRGRGRGFSARGRGGKVREWGSVTRIQVKEPEVKPVKPDDKKLATDPNFNMNVIITFVNMLSVEVPVNELRKFNIHRFNSAQFAKIMECVNCFRILVEQGIWKRSNAEKMMILAVRFNLALYTDFLKLICGGITAFKNNEIIDYIKGYISKIKDDVIMKTVCGITRTALITATHVSRVCMLKGLNDDIPELLNVDVAELKRMREILVGYHKTYSQGVENPYIGLINSLLTSVDKKIKNFE